MTENELKWHRRFLDVCYLVASWSKDRSTKTGCVIVRDRKILASGYNGFTPGVDDENDEFHQRPTKYLYIEHCDRNAIYQASLHGISLVGATMYLTGVPCHDCARGIVQSGIVRVVWPEDNPFEKDPEVIARWKDSLEAAFHILEAKGVEIVRVP